MNFFKFTHTLYLLSFVSLLQTVLGTDDSTLNTTCSSTAFSTNEAFASNLNQLITSLTSSISPSGFSKSSLVKNSDQVYGLALCRGDIKEKDCQACLETAAGEIRQRCAQSKAAIIWHNICMLKYSNKNIFGVIDHRNVFYQCIPEGVTVRPGLFIRMRRKLFRRLAKEANNSCDLLAVGDIGVGKEKIYGLVKCIHSAGCRRCIIKASRSLGTYCYAKKGGKFYSGSRNVRFEMNPFVE